MSLSIGIVGLPNVGKSTLFNALTKNNVLAANYPFATIEPNVGVVGVPDPLGTSLQMMISDVTFALENDLAADLVDVLDLPFPEEDDESQPGGDVDLLIDLGMNVMEIEALASDPELFPDEAVAAIAHRLGFGPQFDELYD